MATVHTDQIRTLSLLEEDGAKMDMVREYLVTGLTTADWSVLDEAIDTAGVPTVNSSPVGYSNLKLKSRHAELVPGTTDSVRVQLHYVNAGHTGYNFVFRGGATLSQVASSVDINGNAVSTTHTYPNDHSEKAGETETQGAQLSVLAPQNTYSAEGILFTDWPDRIAREWIGYVNNDWWAGDAPGVWLCAHVEFAAHDITKSPKWWKFVFEFQHDNTGWQPQAIHIDPTTGKPPPSLVAGVGARQYEWHPAKTFGLQFPI